MKVGFVWADNQCAETPMNKAGVTVGLWTQVIDDRGICWIPGKNNMPDLSKYEFLIVNQLGNMTSHIRDIKKAFPEITIMAMPDTSIDLMLMDEEKKMIPTLFEHANIIGARTPAEVGWWESFTGRKTFWMPSPLGPKSQLDELIVPIEERENTIILTGHTMLPFAEGFNWAAVKEISRWWRGKFVMYRPNDIDREYAKHLNLDVEFKDKVGQIEFAAELAKAKMTVDLYPRWSIHRHAILAAALKVPCIASRITQPFFQGQLETFMDAKNAGHYAYSIMDDSNLYNDIANSRYNVVYNLYGFEACRERLNNVYQNMHGKNGVKSGYIMRANNDYTDKTGKPDQLWQVEVYRIARQYGNIYNRSTVYDLGCGDGYKLMTEMQGFDTVGVDYGKNIEYVRMQYPGHEYQNSQWIDANLEEKIIVPEKNQRAFAICADVIEHMLDTENLWKTLRNFDMTVLSTPDRDMVGNHNGPPDNHRHVFEYTFTELRDEIERRGFRIEYMNHVRSSDKSDNKHTICAVIMPIVEKQESISVV